MSSARLGEQDDAVACKERVSFMLKSSLTTLLNFQK